MTEIFIALVIAGLVVYAFMWKNRKPSFPKQAQGLDGPGGFPWDDEKSGTVTIIDPKFSTVAPELNGVVSVSDCLLRIPAPVITPKITEQPAKRPVAKRATKQPVKKTVKKTVKKVQTNAAKKPVVKGSKIKKKK